MKSSPLFSKPVPLECLFELLDKICASGDTYKDYYMVDKLAFKKMVLQEYHTPFLETLMPYYRKSRQFYITREFTYNSFVNLIRQICTLHAHPFLPDKQYSHQEYTIRYVVEKRPIQ